MDLFSVTESVCEYAELGKMSMDENHEWSKANDDQIWGPLQLIYTPQSQILMD